MNTIRETILCSLIISGNIVAISLVVSWVTLLLRRIKLDRGTSVAIGMSIYWLILVICKGGFM